MPHEFLRPAGWTPKLGKRPTAENFKVSNKSGSDISAGSLVIKDLANMTTEGVAVRVKTTTTVADRKAYGVALTPLDDTKMGYVTRYGPVEAATSDAAGDIAVGDELVASDYAAGFLEKAAPGCPASAVIAYAMEAQASDSVLATPSTHTLVFVDPSAAAPKLANDMTAAGAGPSPLIWDSCPWAQMQVDPTIGYSFFDDFLRRPVFADGTTQNGYITDQDTGVTIQGLETYDEVGGVIEIANNDADNDFGHLYLAEAAADVALMKIATTSHKEFWFEARLKLASVANNRTAIFVGLGETGLITADGSALTDDTGVPKDENYIGFSVLCADGDLVKPGYRADGQVAGAGTGAAITADTYFKCGLHGNGTTIGMYIAGALDLTVTAAIIAGATFPSATMMTMMLLSKTGAATEGAVQADWWRFAALR